MVKNTDQDQVADFSNFFNKQSQTEPANSGGENLEDQQPTGKKKWITYAVAAIIILAVAEVVLLVMNQAQKNPPLPEGYELVDPGNQPAYIKPTQNQ